ncbi:MAG TPA: hypothetical protein VK066_16080 [Chloroflexota bacterium]|nr:hypothetical protein [Chloroflexota bacterium]
MTRHRPRRPKLPAGWRGALGLLALAATACGAAPSTPAAPATLSLRELDRRVSDAWSAVQRYRTVETIERQDPSGQWELTSPPAETEFVLPSRKYRRPVEQGDPPGVEFMVVDSTIYQRLDGVWSIVDMSQVPPDSAVARSLEQLRTAGLDGPPFRLPKDVNGQLAKTGDEVLDGRSCRWYAGTAQGPAGPVQLRVALEQDRDLPCKTEAEYAGPATRARSTIRYFDYNSAIRIDPPGPAA